MELYGRCCLYTNIRNRTDSNHSTPRATIATITSDVGRGISKHITKIPNVRSRTRPCQMTHTKIKLMNFIFYTATIDTSEIAGDGRHGYNIVGT